MEALYLENQFGVDFTISTGKLKEYTKQYRKRKGDLKWHCRICMGMFPVFAVMFSVNRFFSNIYAVRVISFL